MEGFEQYVNEHQEEYIQVRKITTKASILNYNYAALLLLFILIIMQ